MQGIKIAILFAEIFIVCWAGRQSGDPCKGIGTCRPQGSCAEGKMLGRCCGGLDCCDETGGGCTDDGAACHDGAGTCTASCSGTVVEGNTECCEGLSCCTDCTPIGDTCDDSADVGICFTGDCDYVEGDTLTANLDCCGGATCCKFDCVEKDQPCGKDDAGICVDTCEGEGQDIVDGNCCTGTCCAQQCLSGVETCPNEGNMFQCRTSSCESGGKVPYYGGCCQDKDKRCCMNPE